MILSKLKVLHYSLILGTRICCHTKVFFWSHITHSTQLQQKLTITWQRNVTWYKGTWKNILVTYIVISDHYCVQKDLRPPISYVFFLNWVTVSWRSLPFNVVLQPSSTDQFLWLHFTRSTSLTADHCLPAWQLSN